MSEGERETDMGSSKEVFEGGGEGGWLGLPPSQGLPLVPTGGGLKFFS